MIKLHKSIPVNASPEAVWAVLGDLSRAADYIPGVVSAAVNGMQRWCRDADGHDIREEISGYSPELRRYSFRHTQSPLPVTRSQGSFQVTADGAGSTVAMDWELEPLDEALEAQLTPMLDGAADMTLANLRRRAETGA